MPQENIIYFGDTGRVPYGSRGRETITKYARQDVAFLRTFDLKAVVIAAPPRWTPSGRSRTSPSSAW